MLDMLLNAPRDKRKKLLTKINAGTRRRIFDKIYTMTEELGLDDIPDFETRVKMRHELIQRFPDTVFWDYAEHATIDSGRAVGETSDFERFDFCKISTRGDVALFNSMKKLYIHTAEPRNRYGSVGLNYKPKTHHRLVASTFIPRPDRLKDIPYRRLQVNHIDGTRWVNNITNLEWVSDKENQRHRYLVDCYHEEKYFLFKVVVDNGFKDREFVLSENDLHIFGTNFTSLRAAITKCDTFKGFHVMTIEREGIRDTYVGLPSDIAELLNRDPRYFNVNIMPVIGTVLRGKFKGVEFSLFGGVEINKYFNRCGVEAVIKGIIHKHYGCAFRRATHREAIPLHGKLTKKIVADARRSREPCVGNPAF